MTLFIGKPPRAFQRFLARFIRYRLHVFAFLTLAANPFPGFTGAAGTYPLDLELPADPQRQNRWKTLFRLVLVIPALDRLRSASWARSSPPRSSRGSSPWSLGRAPWGLRNLDGLRAPLRRADERVPVLLTDAYPHASPLEGDETTTEA